MAGGDPRGDRRTGGDLVVEALDQLGADAVFGLPGVHALPIWDALRRSNVMHLVLRTELNAAFAAEAYAQASGRPSVLLVSTGPGALVSLAGVMEAATTHVPMVVIAPEVPRDAHARNRGYLHELPDQLATFRPIVKRAVRATSAEAIPGLLAEAWSEARRHPNGPVYVGVPYDVIRDETSASPTTPRFDDAPVRVAPTTDLDTAAQWLTGAERPVLWAGGGVLRAGAWRELRSLAERLVAPVLTTYMGKGAIPEDHPLAGGSGCEQRAYRDLLEAADVILAVGTELGSETTAQYRLRLTRRLIHADIAPERIGTTYPALALVGDARATLAQLRDRAKPCHGHAGTETRLRELRERIDAGLRSNGQAIERDLVDQIRAALPADAIHAWDSTTLAYWGGEYFPAMTPRTYLYPLGSGTIGYALPAALGAALARPGLPVLAVCGDGGFAYGTGELATARQYGLNVTLVLVNDCGFGILRHYQRASFGVTHAVDLVQPDFAALCSSFGVPTHPTTPASFGPTLAQALAETGPSVVLLEHALEAPIPTT